MPRRRLLLPAIVGEGGLVVLGSEIGVALATAERLGRAAVAIGPLALRVWRSNRVAVSLIVSHHKRLPAGWRISRAGRKSSGVPGEASVSSKVLRVFHPE
jgi:hypothetical protein